MRVIITVFAVAASTIPALAQLSPEAFTWGAEVYENGRSTVIYARKHGDIWTVKMECTLPQRGGRERVLRYRGTARWEGNMMLGDLDRGMKIVVASRDDGDLAVVTSGNDCANGRGLLTSGG